jgi:hypothetical protein
VIQVILKWKGEEKFQKVSEVLGESEGLEELKFLKTRWIQY